VGSTRITHLFFGGICPVRTIPHEVRNRYLSHAIMRSVYLAEQGQSSPDLKVEEEQVLIGYEQGLWYEMKRYGIHLWWLGLPVLGVALWYFFGVGLRETVWWLVGSMLVSTIAYFAAISLWHRRLERRLKHIQDFLAESSSS
jgi:hypothetical protein